MSYAGNCTAPLAEPDAPDHVVVCQVCGEDVEPGSCCRCGGEGGSQSYSDDDGRAWSACGWCTNGIRYFCWGGQCKGAEVDEDGKRLRNPVVIAPVHPPCSVTHGGGK